jgi:AraC-like DNA-binding protein
MVPAEFQSPVTRLRFKHFDQMAAAIRGADIEMTLLEREQTDWELLYAPLFRCEIQCGTEGAAHTGSGSCRPGLTGFVVSLESVGPHVFNGHTSGGGRFVHYQPGAEISGFSAGPDRWLSCAVPPAMLACCISALSGWEPAPCPSPCTLVEPEAVAGRTLLDTLRRSLAVIETSPEVMASPEARFGMERELLEAFVRAFLSRPGAAPAGQRALLSRRRIVARADEYLRANLGQSVYVEDLCRVTEVSERSLFYAFQEIYGTSPLRYLKLRRLCQARRGLQAANPQNETVTGIATHWGFWELGRFAAEYRQLFGELPSATLSHGKGVHQA